MKPGTLLLKRNYCFLLLSCLIIALLATACGTLQVDLAPTVAPIARPGVRVTPTASFYPPPVETEVGVVFDDRLEFVGYSVDPESPSPGSRITVTLIWQVLDKIDAEYNTFVHLFNKEDQLLAQSDTPTGGGYRLPTDWIIEEYVYDQHHLILPAGMTLDDVEIRIGLYDFNGGQRMDIESPNTYTLQVAAPPTPVVPTPKVSAPRPTDTPELPQMEETKLPPAAGESLLPVQGSQEIRVAYIKDGNAWIWQASAGPQQLTRDGGIEGLWLSDDGELIAFLRDQEIWVVESNGQNERQLIRPADYSELSLEAEEEHDVSGITPYQVAWRPHSHQLFFNTSPKIEGPGLFLSDDLWMVDVDSGSRFSLLGPGEGGKFYFSPNSQLLAIVKPGRIDLMEVDGTYRREAFTHTPVITYSEYEYHAQPVWAEDSRSLRVAIPPVDFLADETQPASIWYIPVDDKPARLIGEVTAYSPLNNPPLFAPNLDRLAYLVTDQPEYNPQNGLLDVAIAEMGESKIWDPLIYETEVMNMHGWSPDAVRLLFTSPTARITEITVGQPGIEPLISGEDHTVLNITWVDNFRFLYEQFYDGGWDLLLGNVDGSDPQLIDSGTRHPVSHDFTWVPLDQ